jgi:glycerol-3-phosphate acyltransferase PlsY
MFAVLSQIVASAAFAFLCGAIPFAWVAVRLCKGRDLRTIGSGNVGATNASRAFEGKGARLTAFLAIYVLDAGKGLLPTLYLAKGEPELGAVVAAAAILGHVFTPFLGGRGGKGVATATGALLALDWQAVLVALGVFFAVRFATGQVFFGSLALGVALAAAAIFLHADQAFGERLPITLLCMVMAAFLFWTHRSNLTKWAAARRAARGGSA